MAKWKDTFQEWPSQQAKATGQDSHLRDVNAHSRESVRARERDVVYREHVEIRRAKAEAEEAARAAHIKKISDVDFADIRAQMEARVQRKLEAKIVDVDRGFLSLEAALGRLA